MPIWEPVFQPESGSEASRQACAFEKDVKFPRTCGRTPACPLLHHVPDCHWTGDWQPGPNQTQSADLLHLQHP